MYIYTYIYIYIYIYWSWGPARRTADGAILKGKVKAGRQKARHLGHHLEPKGGTSDNQGQNYL